MKKNHIDAYAHLLTNYCCQIKKNDRVLIRSSYLAEPLILACQRDVIKAGGQCEFDISLPKTASQWYGLASDEQLSQAPILYPHAIKSFDVIISIHAPFDIFELKNIDKERLALRQRALKPIKQTMMNRGASGDLRWVICNYPTESLAKAANMTLNEYTDFIVKACFIHTPNPKNTWEELSVRQGEWVERLNRAERIHFKSDKTDISFKTLNRKWINSDGKRNMPSGEIFTSPIESSGQGHVHFDVPSLVFGEVVQGLTLHIKNGDIIEWESHAPVVDDLFSIEGARRIGEIAIGTNQQIQHHTLNTLFDEKIGGTIHMAIGASYPETGGKNISSVHHDFISTFNKHSSIILDGDEIYKNGQFIV